MTDAFLTGLHHALVATAYVAGAGLPVVIGAALILIALFAFRRTKVTRTAWRLHREARRSGRAEAAERRAYMDNRSLKFLARANRNERG